MMNIERVHDAIKNCNHNKLVASSSWDQQSCHSMLYCRLVKITIVSFNEFFICKGHQGDISPVKPPSYTYLALVADRGLEIPRFLPRFFIS